MLCFRLLPVLLCAVMPLGVQAVTVRVTEADGGRVQVDLHRGDVLRVDLAAAPVMGRTWSVRGHVPPQLTELGVTQRVFGGRMSNQGRSSFSWRAIAEGEGELTVAYGTATARATQPEKMLKVEISVAGTPLGPEEEHPRAVSQLRQAAVYERSLPCGDCSGLIEQLSLYRGPGENPLVLRSTYKDAPGGTFTTISTGSWNTGKGSADPAATLYTLTTSSGTSFFRLAGDRLLPLDAQQIPLPSPPGADNAFHNREVP